MDTASKPQTSVVALLAAEIGEFITVAEAAEILRVTRQTTYNLVDAGAFGEVVRVGRAIRIPIAAFRSYALTGRAAVQTEAAQISDATVVRA